MQTKMKKFKLSNQPITLNIDLENYLKTYYAELNVTDKDIAYITRNEARRRWKTYQSMIYPQFTTFVVTTWIMQT